MVYHNLVTRTGSETAESQTVTLAASSLTKMKFSPTSFSTPIIGMELIFNASIGGLASGDTTISDLLEMVYTMKATSGSDQTLLLSGSRQLEEFYHIKTGLAYSATAPSITGGVQYLMLPFVINPALKFVLEFDFNGYTTFSTDATSGSMTVTIRYIFGTPQDNFDFWTVVPTPSLLNANVDVNLAQYINDARQATQLWIDTGGADSNLNYYKFENGKQIVYDSLDSYTLSQLETYLPGYVHVSGLFEMPIIQGITIDSNANTSIKPIINLASSLAPVIFLKVVP